MQSFGLSGFMLGSSCGKMWPVCVGGLPARKISG